MKKAELAKLVAEHERYRKALESIVAGGGWAGAEARQALRPMKKVRNLMTGEEIEIDADTPLCCDPSSETYWSM